MSSAHDAMTIAARYDQDMIKVLVFFYVELLVVVFANEPLLCSCENGACSSEMMDSKCGAGRNYCTHQPCQNGGSCISGVNSFSCICPPGFTDKYCTTIINNCITALPCRNGGTCINNTGTYACLCPSTYAGPTCSSRACTANYCLNGGTCTVTLGTNLQCRCPKDTTGSKCEFYNGAIENFKIVNTPPQELCSCENKACSMDSKCGANKIHCTLQPCQNGGSCISGVNSSYSCICPSGFTDKNCTTIVNNCITKLPCQNGGTCVNSTGTYACLCPPTYTGLTCSSRACTANYCLNGGTCTVTLGTNLQCRCPEDTTGSQCEFYNGAIENFKLVNTPP